jgi:hypothetical protein
VATVTERQDIRHAARMLGVPESRVERELASALSRSEPDPREVYGQVDGIRFVARREKTTTPWWVSLERRPGAWERAPTTGWSG